MFKTVVNFRYDRGHLSIDSCLTREWDSTLVEAAGSLTQLNPNAVAVLYANADKAVVHGMTQLARAEHGMKARRAMDSAIEGPFVLDHAQEMTDEDLLAWFQSREHK